MHFTHPLKHTVSAYRDVDTESFSTRRFMMLQASLLYTSHATSLSLDRVLALLRLACLCAVHDPEQAPAEQAQTNPTREYLHNPSKQDLHTS